MTVTSMQSELTGLYALPTPDAVRPALPAKLRHALSLIPAAPVSTPNQPLLGSVPEFPDANCKGEDLDEFYLEDQRFGHAQIEFRQRVCGPCPHQTECMIWALRNETDGLWCLTPTERGALGGIAHRRYGRTPAKAAEAAVRAGVDPDNLATALRVVHTTPAKSLPATPRTFLATG